MQFIELTKLADKQKWMHRFFKAYDGETFQESDALYGANVRFIVAIRDGKELGFIRINDKSAHFKEVYDGPVWNLTDAYVKPAYCHQGVLRSMITHAIDTLNVKMLYMQTDRYASHRLYYESLGFSLHWTVKGGQMTWSFVSDFTEIALKVR